MIGIAQKVARNFNDAVRSRGQSYFVKGRVTVMAARPGEVVARVRGTSKYRVRLRLRGSKLLASCSCPYFSPQGDPCKHLWATLLLVESRGLLQSPPVFPLQLVAESPRRSPAVEVLENRSESGLDRDRDQEPPPRSSNSDLGMVGMGPHRPAGMPARGTKPRGNKDRGVHGLPPSETGSWSQRGPGPGPPSPRDRRTGAVGRSKTNKGVIGAGHGTSPGAARTKAVNRNAKRLLVYVLDVAATLAQNQVVIDLARRQRKTTGEWGPLRPWYYAPHAAHVKYDPEDRLILASARRSPGLQLPVAAFRAGLECPIVLGVRPGCE